MTTPEEILAQVPLFSMLPKKELNRLAREAHDRTFAAGTVLTDEQETGVTFGVIVEGRAAVSVRGRPVRTLGPGDYFGEMALIDRSYRSATITAETGLRCLMFVAWVFRPFAMEHPESSWALLEMMVQRVRDAESR
ncbi:MAG: cyclic nucleotide-binding domain-containing protein [Streptosporangiaceae bacterium]|jgi:CRP/FNR family cyclic AMP-dependent transcriptional regulator